MLGAEIELRPAMTYSQLLEAVITRTVHLAWLGPAVFVRARARCEVEPLARPEREGGLAYRAAIFVRESSPFHAPSDLSGARVAWVDPSSCAGYLYPRLALARAGFDVETGLESERFVGSHAAVVRAVETDAVDAGAAYVELEDPSDPTSRVVRAAWTDTPLEARAILISDPVPADVVVATRALEGDDRARARRELLALHETEEGTAVLRDLFHASALRSVDLADYETVSAALVAAGEQL